MFPKPSSKPSSIPVCQSWALRYVYINEKKVYKQIGIYANKFPYKVSRYIFILNLPSVLVYLVYLRWTYEGMARGGERASEQMNDIAAHQHNECVLSLRTSHVKHVVFIVVVVVVVVVVLGVVQSSMFECNTILAESCVKRGAVVISAHHQHRRRRRMRRNVIRCILKNGRIQYDAVCNRAARSGLQLKKTSLGPFFRFTVVEDASLRDGGDSSQQQQQTSSSSFNKDSVGMEENTLGYCTGYMLPYLNLNSDTMPASNETSSSSSHADIVPTPPPPGKSILSKVVHLDAIEVRNTHKNSSVYGTSLTLGTAALVYAQEQGCTKARLLAIFDDYHTHKKLVKVFC